LATVPLAEGGTAVDRLDFLPSGVGAALLVYVAIAPPVNLWRGEGFQGMAYIGLWARYVATLQMLLVPTKSVVILPITAGLAAAVVA